MNEVLLQPIVIEVTGVSSPTIPMDVMFGTAEDYEVGLDELVSTKLCHYVYYNNMKFFIARDFFQIKSAINFLIGNRASDNGAENIRLWHISKLISKQMKCCPPGIAEYNLSNIINDIIE